MGGWSWATKEYEVVLKLISLRLCCPPTIPTCAISLLAIIWTLTVLKPPCCQTVCNSFCTLLRGAFNRKDVVCLSAVSSHQQSRKESWWEHFCTICTIYDPMAHKGILMISISRTGECSSVAQLNLNSAVVSRVQGHSTLDAEKGADRCGSARKRVL